MTKNFAVLSSGGDAPGMNAAVRAVVLACEREGGQVIGYRYGYNGLLSQSCRNLNAKTVHNLIQQGGTVLHSGRCPEFKSEQSAKTAAANLNEKAIDCLIVIGGDGSFRGAAHLSKYWSGQVIGLPGTIDNDIPGTDATIGYYTAIETAVTSIDKVRDTADAFERLFLVEVMGRHAGFLALKAAIASASDYVILPELFESEDKSLNEIELQLHKHRKDVEHDSFIIVVAENVWPGGLDALSSSLAQRTGSEIRPVILGHVQRGGSPVSQDRILATKLGCEAVQAAYDGDNCIMIGEQKGELVRTPLSEVCDASKPLTASTVKTMKLLLNNRYA
ncbi:ATP-dependent 6-phosphofructokinase [Alteromonas sediminis]|uniref:6-phosphofructokinase n=1 Tax=Alteromonas sediminis TaxID=2259342 RepID=A0A3N5Y167_9ALTE|nr:ATP-dependent 6-phosphofructokinase [Alteromonas sediminis]RPJ67537.1 ATP-dependent 6-phosphofructokinase [Alteromonas sediminis]